MKQLLLLLLLSLLGSCTVIKMVSDQSIELENNAIDFELSQKMIMDVNFNQDIQRKLVFDTGATTIFITDSTLFNMANKERLSHLGTVKDADKNKSSMPLFTLDVSNNLFNAKNKIMRYLERSASHKPKCLPKNNNNHAGYMGLDIFSDAEEAILYMDFTNKKLDNLTEKELADLMGFEKILSKFNFAKNVIYIYLNINNNTYKMKLDTGNSVGIFLPKKELEKDANPADYVIQKGVAYRTALSGNENQENWLLLNQEVSLNNYNINQKISYVENDELYNVGLNFIKHFDWVIDFEREEIYIRKNNVSYEEKIEPQDEFYVGIQNDLLQITMTQGSFNQLYAIGSVIEKVNGESITKDNLCDMYIMINKTFDKKDLSLTFMD